MVTEDDKIRRTLLRKMFYHEFIGAKHTSIDNLPKSFPGDKKKKIMKVVYTLIKEGYFILKPKPDSLHVSLNPKMLKKIRDIIKATE